MLLLRYIKETLSLPEDTDFYCKIVEDILMNLKKYMCDRNFKEFFKLFS